MTPHSPNELKRTFDDLRRSRVGDVPGVIRIDGKWSGPVLGITVCTHGNEPAGLAIISHLLEKLDIRNTLERGTLYLVVNNIQATERYFSATDEEGKRNARFCKVNMNRLPPDTFDLANDSDYEIMRARELRQIWEAFGFSLDVHSTTDPDPPMIISRGDTFHADLVRGFPIEDLISNIDNVQINRPAFAFYGGDKGFAIEAGQHEAEATLQCAVTCAESLLQNIGMCSGTRNPDPREYIEYRVREPIMFADMSYDFVKDFKHKEVVSKDQVLARSETKGKSDLTAPFDGVLIMPSDRRGDKKVITEEQGFISLPPKLRRVS